MRSLGVLLGLVLPARAAAQTCTASSPPASPWTCAVSTSTSLTIGDVMQLALSSAATALTAPAVADYDAGFVADNGPTATVKSNRAWRLQISAAAATWTAANTEPGVTARAAKPAGDLQWGTAGGGPFTPLAVAATTSASGSATATTTADYFFRTVYDWTVDTPGAYSLTVVFTLVAP